MNSEQLTTTAPERESRRTEAELEAVADDLGFVVLFRVMNLDNHSGLIHEESVIENGEYKYVVDNLAHPEQGDYAYAGENAFDDAFIKQAFPHRLSRIHAVRVPEHSVVVPDPTDPTVVIIKNGTEADAKRVPIELINEHVNRPAVEQTDPKVTQEVIEKLFGDKK